MNSTNKLPEDLDPKDGIENKENLQNNSEENTKSENEDTNSSAGRKHYRKDNRRIANLKNTKSRKQEKLARLNGERDTKKADLDRGYLIVQLGDDSERVKHVPLDASDKEMIRSVIAEKEFEIYELGLDIDEIDLKLRELAAAKKTSFKDRLSKKRQVKKEDDLVDRVGRELNKASQNGDEKIISEIQQQVKSGKKNEAYDSLKSFLSEQVKPVAKKLDKSEQLEKKVLDRVLEKLSKVQA